MVLSYTITNDITGSVASPKVLTSSDHLTLFTIDGATAMRGFKLPTAVANLTIGFVVTDTDGLAVFPNTGDAIRLGTTGSVSDSQSAQATAVGDVLILTCVDATTWIVISRITSAHWSIV